MSIFALTDSALATLHRQATAEIARRARAAVNGHDAATIIFGNEVAKRALVVAAAGSHSILFLGPPNCGKTMLRAVALELGLTNTFEARPCPCGHRNDPQVACRCTARQVARWPATWPATDISIEVVQPSQRESNGRPSTTLADMQNQIAAKTSYQATTLDEDCRHLLRAAAAELGLDVDVQNRIVAVARTIANLDQAEQIAATHICEAINYRMLGR